MKMERNHVRMTLAGMLVLLAGIGAMAPELVRAGDDHAPAGHGAPVKHAPAAKAPPPSAKAEPKAPAPKHADEEASHDEREGDAAATPPTDAKKPASKPATATKSSKDTKSNAEPEVEATADGALSALREGNLRWVAGKVESPNTDAARRRRVADEGQKPFATILTCADSRLPVERVFDRGVGELFVVRVAGNVVGTPESGTIEYGVEHLGTPLIVVMGHSKCGAVKAACAGEKVGGNIDALLENIKPAVDRARASNEHGAEEDVLDAAVRENVWQSVFALLKQSPTLVESVREGKVKIVGAVCEISTGRVEFLGQHPWQGQLMEAMAAAGHDSEK